MPVDTTPVVGQLHALARVLRAGDLNPHAVAGLFGGTYHAGLDELRVPASLGPMRFTLQVKPTTAEAAEHRAKELQRRARDRPSYNALPRKPSQRRAPFAWSVAERFLEDGEVDNLREYLALYDVTPAVTDKGEIVTSLKPYTVRDIDAFAGRVFRNGRWRWISCEPRTGSSLLGKALPADRVEAIRSAIRQADPTERVARALNQEIDHDQH